MNRAEWGRLSAEFDALCDLAPGERQARLAGLERSGVDAAFVAELGAMLAADGDDDGGLATAGAAALGEELRRELERLDPTVSPGVEIGPWRLVARLGAGGMGEVWSAERADGAFDQRVAVKLLKRGLETESLLRRFYLERRILARLAHPGIARLVDAGSTATGRPYFVMELVDGRPITAWVAERRPALDERLRLFLKVVDAVDFAHRNLIVHRDLKPSNVLVEESGDVKLLDFGIAKLLEAEGGAVPATELEGRILTPDYAAPEQIVGAPATMATDVYALGVLLYELLTGELPHRRRSTRLPELAAQLSRATIERPSTAVRRAALSAKPDRAPAIAPRRLAGDLDTIVLKALAGEPERRYHSAADLGRDVERFLHGRPVEARPESKLYRTRKFVSRHRWSVGGAAIIAILLFGGLAGTLWQARRAEANAERAERVKDFLVDLFSEAEPQRAMGKELSARELLDRGTARIAPRLSGDPALEADLDEALSQIRLSLGEPNRAAELAERAVATRERRLAPDALALASARFVLGRIRIEQGRPVEARALLDPVAAEMERRYGRDSLDFARVEVLLAGDEVEPDDRVRVDRLRHAIRVFEAQGEASPFDLARAQMMLAVALDDADSLVEAEPVYRMALARFDAAGAASSSAALGGRCRLGKLQQRLGRYGESLANFEQAIAEVRRIEGGQHIDLAEALFDYGVLLHELGRQSDAEKAFDEALAIGIGGRTRGLLLRSFGLLRADQGRLEEAAALCEESIRILKSTVSSSSPGIWRSVACLGKVRGLQGRGEEGERLLRSALEKIDEVRGPRRYDVLLPLGALAELLLAEGRFADATAVLTRERALEVDLFGTEDHPFVAKADRQLAAARAGGAAAAKGRAIGS